ncbi:hypothetical protein BKA65DRAFT_482489 [Rhexocercosporidium sp. MPI-PUGE-AT-0058]|nr:hypothetical protein BKA65DRAFT_482489 [Rhexocercosporidium sp. MPI-PUGE-AT-0058]
MHLRVSLLLSSLATAIEVLVVLIYWMFGIFGMQVTKIGTDISKCQFLLLNRSSTAPTTFSGILTSLYKWHRINLHFRQPHQQPSQAQSSATRVAEMIRNFRVIDGDLPLFDIDLPKNMPKNMLKNLTLSKISVDKGASSVYYKLPRTLRTQWEG